MRVWRCAAGVGVGVGAGREPWWVTRRYAGRGRARKPQRTRREQWGCQGSGWFVRRFWEWAY